MQLKGRHFFMKMTSRKLQSQINWNALDISILAPAFLIGLIMLSTHIVLSKMVLERGIIFH
jgi:hypothetical protein